MIGFRCVLILSLILSSTIVTGHSINRRDNENNNNNEGDDEDDDKTKMFKKFSDMLTISAQRIKDSLQMGFMFVKSRTMASGEANSTAANLSMVNSSTDEDTIIFNNEDESDMTPAIATTIIDENNEKEADATTIPTILNRSLLDTPIACGGGQQLGKDGKCRVVW